VSISYHRHENHNLSSHLLLIDLPIDSLMSAVSMSSPLKKHDSTNRPLARKRVRVAEAAAVAVVEVPVEMSRNREA